MVIGSGTGHVDELASWNVNLANVNRDDIHYTAQFSAPSPGGVTRLCADENDKKVRDWFRDQVLALGAKYTVSIGIPS